MNFKRRLALAIVLLCCAMNEGAMVSNRGAKRSEKSCDLLESKQNKKTEMTADEKTKLRLHHPDEKASVPLLILGSTAICYSGMLLLLSEYSRNSH